MNIDTWWYQTSYHYQLNTKLYTLIKQAYRTNCHNNPATNRITINWSRHIETVFIIPVVWHGKNYKLNTQNDLNDHDWFVSFGLKDGIKSVNISWKISWGQP